MASWMSIIDDTSQKVTMKMTKSHQSFMFSQSPLLPSAILLMWRLVPLTIPEISKKMGKHTTLSEEEKYIFWPLGDSLIQYFAMLLCTTRSLVGHETLEGEWYIFMKALEIFCITIILCQHCRVYWPIDSTWRLISWLFFGGFLAS